MENTELFFEVKISKNDLESHLKYEIDPEVFLKFKGVLLEKRLKYYRTIMLADIAGAFRDYLKLDLE